MANTREIKNRIESVQQTRKITNAMYLIASTKLRKARNDLANTRPYFDALRGEIKRVFRTAGDVDSPYFYPPGNNTPLEGTYGCLVITADKGLAGVYNQNVIKEAEKLLAIYCSGNISAEDRFVYYSYIALGGFLWCLWAVYKSSIGEEFGEYTLIMYRYAKEYYKKIVTDPAFLLIGSDF